MKLYTFSLDQIEPCLENPNHHSKEKIEALSENIREFGLIHPLTVKPKDPKVDVNKAEAKFTIISGEGRYLALRKLWSEVKNQAQSDRWDRVPCHLIMQTSDYLDWGRRLSENKMRSFNWCAEAVSLASMREHGKTAKDLSKVFGCSEAHLRHMAALGFIPGLDRLSHGPEDRGEPALNFLQAKQQLLKLRIWPSDIPMDKHDLDYSLYDYAECVTAIEKLVNKELVPEDLPDYVTDRLVVIAEARKEKAVKAMAQAELAQLREQLEVTSEQIKDAKSQVDEAIKKAQSEAAKSLEKAKADLQRQVDEKNQRMQKLLADIENSGADKAKLTDLVSDLEIERDDLEEQLAEKKTEIANLREEIKAEIENEVRETTLELLRQQVEAEKKEEYEQEISEARKTSAEEATKNSKEALRLTAWQARVAKREQELEAEAKRFKETQQNTANVLNLAGWIRVFNRCGEDFMQCLEAANAEGYWSVMDKPELKRIYSVCSGVGDQLRLVNNHFAQKGILRQANGE